MFKVSFWEYDRRGEMTLFKGVVTSEFTDPEDYRPSYNVRLDDDCAEYPNQHMTPYVCECRSI